MSIIILKPTCATPVYEKAALVCKTMYEQVTGNSINVVDKETLIKAKENPESYKDLVVRIGGYSDYFTRIPETMQDEVILRTEHEI